MKTLDLAVECLNEEIFRGADLIAFYVPMHTATRLAARMIPKVRGLNPTAHIAAYGLYAPMNEVYLRHLGVQTVLGGEFEEGLTALAQRLERGVEAMPGEQSEPRISLARQDFVIPDREGLPGLDRYAYLQLPNRDRRTAGYVEASRGCKHLCRHCPVVPVYNGRFRIIPRQIVLEDIRQQVAAGARHITFGDPDFFNGPTHALRIVRAVHEDTLHTQVRALAQQDATKPSDQIFSEIWKLAHERAGRPVPSLPAIGARFAPAQLSEPWYCCAEPTEEQFAPR